MIKLSALVIISSVICCNAKSTILPYDLTVNYLRNPLAVDDANPRLSWLLYGNVINNFQKNLTQTAYQILAASSSESLFTNPDLWDTGKVKSNAQFGIKYQGKQRRSTERIYWTVRVWDQNDEASTYAHGFFWDNALNVSHWTAHWISAPSTIQKEALINVTADDKNVLDTHAGLKPVVYLRKTFTLDSEVKLAKIFATAKGMYRLFINDETGLFESDKKHPLLTPGWTDYNQSFQYQVYDVTKYLKNNNTIGVMLGTGWYSGYIGWLAEFGHYGRKESFLMELHIEFKNSSKIIIRTDNTWKSSTGPVIYSDLYQGELFYEERTMNGWLGHKFDDSKWYGVNSVIINPKILLVAEQSPPIIELEHRQARKAWESSPGVWVYDFGTNWSGYTILKLENFTSNARIQVRHAEVLNPNGTIYTLNLRTARATETYLLNNPRKRKETLVLKPHFTYHGFRYAEVTGYPGMLNLSSIISVRIGIDKINNAIKTDNELVNTLHSNIKTTHLSSFMSVPTDCTQRDERLGWMGDAGIFSHTGIYNGEVGGFFKKWMRDIREAQSPAGGFSNTSPRIILTTDGEPAWGSAGVVVPYNIFRMYGDLQTVEDNYDAIGKWIEYIHRDNKNLLWTNNTHWIFGDWLNVKDETPEAVVATAYFAYDSLMMSEMAKAIGRETDAEKYRKLHDDISKAFVKAFVNTTDGKIQNDTQTGYVLAVAFKLVPEELIPKVMENLVANIERHGWHPTTGFIGVGHLLPVLSDHGYIDVAYKLLLQNTYPSWMYMIEHNATSMWEHWDSWTEETGFASPKMNSFNQYALGSVGRWLYQYMAGIDTDNEEVGFEKIIIKPHIGLGINRTEAVYRSVKGTIRVNWKVVGNTFDLKVTIPVNAKADIILPFVKEKWVKQVSSGVHQFSVQL